jgi:hypothetical protein
MAMRRILAGTLAAALVTMPVVAQQQAVGTISGTAVKEATPPYEEYRVQLRSVATGAVVSTHALSPSGTYTVPNVPFAQPHLIELVNVTSNRIVCTEGPFTLSAPNRTSRSDANIECGGSALWLLLAAAGLPAVVGDPRSADR